MTNPKVSGPVSNCNARAVATHSSEIVAAGFAYPSEVVDNETFFERCRFAIAEDRDALVRETRMKTRRWCTDAENTWTLARSAVEMALRSDPTLKDEIDVVIVASGTTMPVLHPPEADNAGVADLAPLVLRELGRDDALGFDVKACYCTGFLRGLHIADAMLANRGYRAALVIATEQGSRFATAETNRSTFCFIMSDAAGAVVLRRRERARGVGIVDHRGHTEAGKHAWVGIGPDAASTVMRGSRAGEATMTMLVDCARSLMARNYLTPRDVRWLLPIQTHARIVDGLAAALDWPEDKVLWGGDVTGFSGSASIPAALAEHIHSGRIQKGDLILSVAVGAGMNCAGALFHY